MDKQQLQLKLLKNPSPRQKQYELLCMLGMTNVTVEEAAAHFGYTVQSVRNLYLSFMNDEINFFPEISTGPKQSRIQPLVIYKIIALRKNSGLSVTEIKQNLLEEGHNISVITIDRILSQAGFERLQNRFQKSANDTLLFPTNKAANLKVTKRKALQELIVQ